MVDSNDTHPLLKGDATSQKPPLSQEMIEERSTLHQHLEGPNPNGPQPPEPPSIYGSPPPPSRSPHNLSKDILWVDDPGIHAAVVVAAGADASQTYLDDTVYGRALPLRRDEQNNIADLYRIFTIRLDLQQIQFIQGRIHTGAGMGAEIDGAWSLILHCIRFIFFLSKEQPGAVLELLDLQ
jgi:hypothetical protein